MTYESSLLLHVCSHNAQRTAAQRRLSVIDGVLKSRLCIPVQSVQHLAPRLVACLTAVVVLMSTSLVLRLLLDLLALRFFKNQ